MTTKKMEYDAAIGGEYKLPENVQTFQFAADHMPEIIGLTEAIANPNSTKLIFQKLPKHMLRRAMSHNPKRLPRKYRHAHMAQMNKSGTPAKTKRPSRKYRRKPSNLTAEYRRRQCRIQWLETHIWHAKRFHMIENWGYKLASASCDKTFRSSYRATARHCLLQDISYTGCIELVGPLHALRVGLDRMMGAKLGLSMFAKVYTSGAREGTLDLYKPDAYPFGALGRVSFIWRPHDAEQPTPTRQLWLFVHPSIYHDVVDEIRWLFELDDQPLPDKPTDQASPDHLPPTITYSNQAKQIELSELKDNFNRFRLTGPLTQSVLASAFKCKPLHPNDMTWYGDFSKASLGADAHRSQSTYWQRVQNKRTTAELPPQMILALNIEDPRLNRPTKRTKAMPNESDRIETAGCEDTCDIPQHNSVSAIWDADYRRRVFQQKMSTHELCTLRNRHVLIPGQRCPFEDSLQPVPVLLMQRPGIASSDRLGYGSGWDVIVPAGYGISTWMCLVMWGAKPGGLRETETICREACTEQFVPDTLAAQVNDQQLADDLREKYFRRPPNRRVNYQKLSIASPFRCPWSELVDEWSGRYICGSPFYVLRDEGTLQQLETCLTQRNGLDALALSVNCLIPISIDVAGRGSAEKFAIICLPTKSDLKRDQQLKRNLDNEPIYTEPMQKDHQESDRKAFRTRHLKLLKRLRRQRVRKKRRQQETAQRKVLIVPAATAALVDEQRETMRELWLRTSPNKIRHQCSREVIGYLTQAHFSFIKAKSAGIGYITVTGLQHLLNVMKHSKGAINVLIRNPSSANYRKAIMKIRTN